MNTENQIAPTPQIDDVIVGLRRARMIGNDPVVWTMLALEAILRIADNTDVDVLEVPKVKEACELMTFVAPLLSEHLDNSIAPYRIYFTLNAACRLLHGGDDGFRTDRMLHVRWLHADLRSVMYRSALDRRGDPLMRYIRACMAWDAPRLPSMPVQ